MQDSFSIENDFINKITELIEENISNEQFGVSELANQIGMSRSNLLRKVKTLTKLSVSQFIRQVRLKHAMEMLRQTSLTVSEVSYKVGFGSTSYFIKCFGDHYGYPPGEADKRDNIDSNIITTTKKKTIVIVSILFMIALFTFLYLIVFNDSSEKVVVEKSIAVLPFKNDSNDSTNVYFINGLMESILNNLQKIEDLKVISRTSVEKYRINSKTIPEIAQELNVSYFVEGSGQKIGDKILLNIQLIEASTDKHLWAEQYKREIEDIFNLQMEIAKSIADEIEVIITPEEQERINKIPTDNLEAYDYFLKGLDLFHNSKNFEEAIVYFKKAIELDNEFARAYADIAMSYFYIDIFRTEKKYTAELNSYADKAILLDPKLAHGLIAKALSFMMSGDLNTAVSYLEKALEYNPNSSLVINFLSDFYTRSEPNTAKYLEYALKGMALDPASLDSSESSLNYLHLGNAFIQSGFIDEAEEFINKSLEYDPTNLYSEQVRAYILYAKNKDYTETKNILVEALRKDTTRIDIVQEIGKIYYYMRDYEKSFAYYKPFIDARETYNLDIYVFENAKIGKVMYKLGMFEESEKLFASYKNYAENDYSIYKNVSLSMYYSHIGDTQKALEHLRLFSQESNYQYWLVLFLRDDPLVENIKYLPEFEEIMTIIEEKFWKNHKKIRASLEKKNLL